MRNFQASSTTMEKLLHTCGPVCLNYFSSTLYVQVFFNQTIQIRRNYLL